jgi:hypothetical protein
MMRRLAILVLCLALAACASDERRSEGLFGGLYGGVSAGGMP